MGTKTCNKCGKSDLGWNKQAFKDTGKWKLEAHKDSNSDWCIKPYKKVVRMYMGKKSDYVKCKLCLGNSGHCFVDGFFERHPEVNGHTLSEHTAQWHPNGEILDDIDFMVISDEEKAKVRKLWNQPKIQ